MRVVAFKLSVLVLLVLTSRCACFSPGSGIRKVYFPSEIYSKHGKLAALSGFTNAVPQLEK